VKTLILVRHAHALSNERDFVSCAPPGEGLSVPGREQALALRARLASEHIDVGVASELVRTQETLELALGDRGVPRLVLRELNEIHFGRFEAGPLEAYRRWAWTEPADAVCPGGGESRGAAALRVANALELLSARTEDVVLAVGHALPIRYVLDAADGRRPEPRIEPVAHAEPYVLPVDRVLAAAHALRRWSAAPRFGHAQA
jgi:broad specificity phosphatase PhoE